MAPPLLRPSLLLSVLTLTAALPAQQPASSDDSLAGLLGPAMEATLARALARWEPPVLADLSSRLDAVERHLAGLQGGLPYLGPARSGRQLLPPPQQPQCEESPSPLPRGQAPYKKPDVLACAESCKQLRDRADGPQDGVYWFSGMSVPVLCDFSHDGGGWTLLLTAATRDGWDPLSVEERNERAPSLDDNYSILRHADAIKGLEEGGRFTYRIEAQGEKGRRRWGGIWTAPRSYSFLAHSNGQTDVSLIRKFDNWSYKNSGIERRMPWANTGSGDGLLTTSASPGDSWWGTLVTRETQTTFHHSPWVHGEAQESGKVLYWVRE